MVKYSPTRTEIYEVARNTVAALQEMSYRSCLFGSAAYSAYGLQRVPADVDLAVWAVVSDAELVKKMLAERDDRLFRVETKNYPGKYVLYMYISPRSPGHTCKIDIITQKERSIPIPSIPPSCFVINPAIPGVPLIPLLPLIFLKLKGWSSRRRSDRHDQYRKHLMDAEDIKDNWQ